MSFIRKVKRKGRVYLAEVENRRINGKVVQRHIRYVGREADGKTILATADGMGSFQAGQVLADLKYVQLESAVDWWTFAASGPGRRRGLSRVLGRTAEAEWDEAEWFATLRWLQTTLDPLIPAAGSLRFYAQDAQNALCEFDKYERVRLGQGRVRPYTPPQPR